MGRIINKARLAAEERRSARLAARKMRVVRVQTEPSQISASCENSGDSGVLCSHLFARKGKVRSVILHVGAVEKAVRVQGQPAPTVRPPEPVVRIEAQTGGKREERGYAVRAGMNEYIGLGIGVERGSLLRIYVPQGYPRLLNVTVAVEYAARGLEEEVEAETPPSLPEPEAAVEAPVEPAPEPVAPEPVADPAPAPAPKKKKSTKPKIPKVAEQ
jgi:hypothetical protein